MGVLARLFGRRMGRERGALALEEPEPPAVRMPPQPPRRNPMLTMPQPTPTTRPLPSPRATAGTRTYGSPGGTPSTQRIHTSPRYGRR